MSAGSMAAAVASLKMNRALLRKRSVKDLRQTYIDTAEKKTRTEFKKVTPKELAVIRKKIKQEVRKETKRQIGIYIICALVTVLILFVFYWLFVGL